MEIDYDYLQTGTAIGFRASHELCSNYLLGLVIFLIIVPECINSACAACLFQQFIFMFLCLSVWQDKKVFTVSGPYPSLRAALRRRGWVEKINNASALTEATRLSANGKL